MTLTRQSSGEARRGKRGPKSKLYTLDGVSLSLQDWSIRAGIPLATLQNRALKGLTTPEILSVTKLPPRSSRKNVRKQLVAVSIESVLRSWGRP